MKTNNLLLLLLIVSTAVFAQQPPRTLLKGQIIADTLGVENVNIQNLNTNRFSVSDQLGYFAIYARENDTLVFTSMTFDSKKLLLTKLHFSVHLMRVRLDFFVNALDEVVISPYALTGDLEQDHQNIIVATMPVIDIQAALDMQYEDDGQSSPDNTVMPGYVDTRYMMDFEAIAQKLTKLLRRKPRPPHIVYVSEKIFPEAVKEKFPGDFFRETLHLNNDQIGLFLAFCENDPVARTLLDPNKEFELIEFLIHKKKLYDQINKK